MQPYIKEFQTVSPRIKIAEFKKYDVQTLLKESAFLVTDYSSIFFDFAYMQKPLAYYQFDFDKFTKEHYKQGYFDYNTAGFGPVFKTESELVEYLVKKITDGFAQDDCYKARCKDFFPLRDQNNCQRIFEEIAKL
jgi:CDP-glycerol glycerophosphotransferase (TagB/SpsB family)